MDDNQLVKIMLEKWRNSEQIKTMKTANKYYEIENENIEQKTRAYKDAAGNLIQNDSLSNIKIPSGFLRMSVDQKVDYAFGKPFIVNTKLINESITDERKNAYQKMWEEFNSPQNREQIKEIVKNAINCGIGWCYPEVTDKFNIVSTESDTVYPRWTDRTHTNLLAVVRDYIEEKYEESGVQYVNKVEYWDTEVVKMYTCDTETGDLSTNGEPINHLVYSTPTEQVNEQKETGWGKVPFIPLKSSRDEMPLLKLIKKYIDAYDELNSKSVDSLVDDIDPVVVLEGISGDIKDLTEARYLLKHLRIASIEAGGSASYLQANTNIDNVQKKLEHLEKDIKNFSSTVNTQDIKFGSNPSGVALKAAYQDLDIYINKLEIQFEVFIENLKYFYDKWLVAQGLFTEEEVKGIDVIVTLDRDMMINETELIGNTSKLSGLVSQETLDSYNPAVENHEVEQERREQEEEDKLNKNTNDLYTFGNTNNQNESQEENEDGNQEENQENVSQ